MDRKINNVTGLIVLTGITAIAIAAHLQSQLYFGNLSTAIFWLTSLIGTIAAIATGFRAIDILAERFTIVT